MSSNLKKAVYWARAQKAKAGLGAKAMTQEEKAHIKQVFNIFDQDGSGSIDAVELRTVMRALGWEVSKEEVKHMIAGIDADGSGTVDFEEFLSLLENVSATSDPRLEATKTFQLFTGAANSPAITTEHLVRVAKDAGVAMTQEQLQAMIQVADTDGSGDVDLQELVTILRRTGQL